MIGMIGISRLDWLIAWRHLRMGDELPTWVRWLTLLSVYLIAAGGVLAWYAASLDPGSTGTVLGPDGPVEAELGPTALQRYYGTFGGITLAIGVMCLTLGLLGRFFNLLPTIITMSVLLGCMALVVVLSLMSGLEGDLRDKILNQKAHIRVSREDGRPFSEYRGLVDALAEGEGIAGASPYLEGEIMVRSGLNRQGAILTGIVPERQTTVSNLAELIEAGAYDHLDHPENIPEPDPFALGLDETPYRLRHLEEERSRSKANRLPGATNLQPEAKDTKPGLPGTQIPPSEASDDFKPGPGLLRGLEPAKAGDSPPPPDEESEPEPPLVDPEPTAEQVDDGWEDPAEELERLRTKGVLEQLPPPPLPDAVTADDSDWEGDWEDPAEEIPRLREEGKLPPAPTRPTGPAAEPSSEGMKPSEGPALDDDESGGEPILIGRELSLELGVRVGAEVQLITPIGRTTPAGQIPGVLAAQVGGVFFSGMYEYDRKNVYAPLEMVQRFLLTGDRVSGIEVALLDVEDIDAGKAEVERIVAEQGRADDLIVEDWRDLNRNLFSAMFLEKVAMFIALLFVVLVASFGILASNLMSVMEKAKEIAILKAMGTSDSGILRVFIAEGLCVGLLGSFGGIAMGLALCWALDTYGLPLNENVYYIEKLPVVVNPVEVTLVGIAALVIVCISSLYPALVASRLRPVDALRQGDT